jgi:CheY-like chemotaxis protein
MQKLEHVLLVEDDPNDIELILTALKESKLVNEIGVARDGVEALDYLHRRGQFADKPEGNPVVILLDLKMPRMGGIEFLRQLKEDEHMRLIPIVILTSSCEDHDLQECYRLGINAYVVKPVNFVEFIQAVKNTGIFWALLNEPPPDIVK